MWWFGDTHFSTHAEEFDRLFRTHLSNCYQLAGLEIPAVLQQPIRRRAVAALHNPTGFIHPTIDGRETSYYEWLYAGRIDLRQQYTAIHRSEQYLRRLCFGFDEAAYYFRLDVDLAWFHRDRAWTLQIALGDAYLVDIVPDGQSAQAMLRTKGRETPMPVPCAFDQLIELAVPRAAVTVPDGQRLPTAVMVLEGRNLLERYPNQGMFQLLMSVAELEAHGWPL